MTCHMWKGLLLCTVQTSWMISSVFSMNIALRWIPEDLIDDKSILVHVMLWSRQVASHYLKKMSIKVNDAIWQLDNNSLQWRHNDHDYVSNHQPRGCLFNRLFRRRSKKTSKLRVTGLYVGNSPGPVNSPHKGPVTRKMFPFDDVIM